MGLLLGIFLNVLAPVFLLVLLGYVRDLRLNNHPIGEVWRNLRPLQTPPL
jgi:hypothetical protein